MSDILYIGLIAIVILVALAGFILFWFWSMRKAVGTEVKEKELKIEALQAQLESLDQIRDLNESFELFGKVFLVQISTNNEIKQISEHLANDLGYERGEMLNKSLNEFVDKEIRFDSLLQRIKNGDKESGLELKILRKSGSAGIYEIYQARSANRSLNSELTSLIFKDISANREVEDKLSSKDKELSDFLYRSTHDLRGPLSSVLGLANVAKVDIQDQKALYYFDLVIDRVKRLDQILKDLLNLSDKESGYRNLNIINFATLVEDASRAVEHIDGYDPDTFSINQNHSKNLIADYNLMLTIFKRVLDNAIKHRKRDGSRLKIDISTSDFDKGVKVQVSDNGLGMDQELKEKIFDMFYRGNENEDGTGLGLYLVYKALEKMKSKVEIESVKGEGSNFIFYFQSQKEKIHN